jgi:hypothetical protein
VKSSRLLIEHQCPQCGAPFTLEETDHLFACEFCRVKSYLVSRDFFRYMLPNKAPEGKELVYVPYWRFKGMHFSCVSDGIRQRIVDVSHQALESGLFPVSLGLRSQTLKLRFVTPETEGRFLKPGLPVQKMLEIVGEMFSSHLPKPIFDQSFVGETLSLIYSPFYIDGKVYDGVLDRPISSCVPEDLDPSTLEGETPDWPVRFMPALCPNCGWDLDGERDSLVLSCRNCNSAWQAGKRGFTKLRFGYIPEEGEGVTYLPFYRIKADISGIDLESYADLVKIANLPKVVQEEWRDRAFRFWSPAFKVRPEDLMRFGRNLTLSQPQVRFEPEFPRGGLHPVTLSIKEAVEGLKVNLAGFMKPRGTMYPKLREIEIRPRSFVLVYIPFRRKGSELTQPDFRLRINRKLLVFARNL